MITPQRITLNDAAKYLAYKDKRAAEEWCKSKGVAIHIERRHKYIYEMEFRSALQFDEIQGIKKKHPENWKEIYCELQKGNTLGAFELANSQELKIKESNGNSYKPQGNYSKRFSEKHSK